ncbi:hypothetical protein [Comamonas thiooxydans]|uniref:hypothetical protein n=1 Tax=Comamonas thiooxydans TaxID=363952 RepID=UPI00209BC490|nr:hypothetical protein [Comamonas thiooxydans]MCO8250069.1 hypothetical protein [Comamonas thiooxydans]
MKLICIGIDQIKREFDICITVTEDGYAYFEAYYESKTYGFFELVLEPKLDGSYMVKWMNADGYRKFGIPEAIIPFAAAHLSTVIHSSPSYDGNNYRIPEATKAWERIVKAGRAVYNREADTFRTR